MNNTKNEFEKIMDNNSKFNNNDLNEMQKIIDSSQNSLKELARKERINVLKLGKKYDGKHRK